MMKILLVQVSGLFQFSPTMPRDHFQQTDYSAQLRIVHNEHFLKFICFPSLQHGNQCSVIVLITQ